MRVGFFGTPDLAARCLEGLAARHDIVFAVTAPDKPAGRSLKLQESPVKRAALAAGTPLFQPPNLRDPALPGELAAFGADIFVIVAYGMIVPAAVFNIPPLRTLNLHPSLLPKYRGPAPMQWAVMNGEAETGLTVQVINERLDAGDIVLQETIPLGEDATAGDLEEIVAGRGADILDRAVSLLASGGAGLRVQDESEATYCPKIDRVTALIDWTQSADHITNRVRGLNPRPGAFCFFRGDEMKLWKTRPFRGDAPPLEPGFLARHGKKTLLAGTGTVPVEILSLQPAAKKVMDGLSFLNGYRIAGGERFQAR